MRREIVVTNANRDRGDKMEGAGDTALFNVVSRISFFKQSHYFYKPSSSSFAEQLFFGTTDKKPLYFHSAQFRGLNSDPFFTLPLFLPGFPLSGRIYKSARFWEVNWPLDSLTRAVSHFSRKEPIPGSCKSSEL